MNTKYLLTPGPVELPAEVLRAGARPLIGHRCPAFSELFTSIEKMLQELLKSEGPVIILPSSGTGALECMAVNFLEKGDKFISISCGVFGNRFREIALRTGAEGINIDVEFGESVTPKIAADAVKNNPGCKVLMITHNETSTAVVNPIKEIIAAIPEKDRPLIFVDGVSSVGAMECFPQEWGIDVLGTASQKGLLTPPGLGLVWLSEKAWKALDGKICPSYSYDLKLHKKELEAKSPANPFTPPVSLYYALEAALSEILERGTDIWFNSHRKYADALAAGLEAMGFDLLAKNKEARSSGVTAFKYPGGDTEAVRKKLRAMGIETAGGQGKLKGILIRVAHYNNWGWPELCIILGSLYGAAGMAQTLKKDFLAEAWNVWNKED
ncbi:MAG: alanine--glyoxylate aminotransferase family protein [Synergistaceae bacterium]|nr:alanine--glyoxylate aminotransferase family protein [Synergistaceae bacterium]